MITSPARVLPMLAAGALLSAAGIFTSPVAPAQADVPSTPVVEFTADECAGTTTEDPATQQIGEHSLLDVFGERLESFNAGSAVMLYGTNGANEPSTPNCATRHVEGVGAVSEWIYCTDMTNHTCSVTDDEGRLTHDGGVVGAPEPTEANTDLTAEEHQIISYIVTHDMEITPLPEGYGGTGATLAADDSAVTRAARQQLVWCVSDADLMHYYPGMDEWCPDNIGEDKREQILAGLPDDPVLEISPDTTSVDPGEEVELTLSTNLLNQPIEVASTSGTLDVCTPQDGITLTDGTLTVASDHPATREVALCSTPEGAEDYTVTASATAYDGQEVDWVQSPNAAPDGTLCQVYAIAVPRAANELSVNTAVTVNEEDASETDADADAGAEADAGTDADAGAGAEADAGTDADAGAEADAGANADAATEADAGTDADAGTEADAGTDADAGAGAEADAGTDADAGAEADAGTNADAGAEADAGANADAGADAGAGAGGTSTGTADASGNDELPRTGGTATMPLSIGAAALVALGGALLLISRRRADARI